MTVRVAHLSGGPACWVHQQTGHVQFRLMLPWGFLFLLLLPLLLSYEEAVKEIPW